MSPEMAVLAKNPVLPILLWVIGVGVGMGIEQLRARRRRNAWRRRNRPRWERDAASPRRSTGPSSTKWDNVPTTPPDAADQLRIVMGAAFAIQPLLNKSELRVLKELERFVETCNPQWQVMAQVSLGEILRSRDTAAYACINSKRIDLLLIDAECLPRHAIEYQGLGHHQGTAAARDAVKKEALRRAGIGYHEVVAGHTTPSELRRLVERLVAKPQAPSVFPQIAPAPPKDIPPAPGPVGR